MSSRRSTIASLTALRSQRDRSPCRCQQGQPQRGLFCCLSKDKLKIKADIDLGNAHRDFWNLLYRNAGATVKNKWKITNGALIAWAGRRRGPPMLRLVQIPWMLPMPHARKPTPRSAIFAHCSQGSASSRPLSGYAVLSAADAADPQPQQKYPAWAALYDPLLVRLRLVSNQSLVRTIVHNGSKSSLMHLNSASSYEIVVKVKK